MPDACVDLDGVLNLFDEWRCPEYFHPARPGAREFLAALKANGFRVTIFTVRYGPWVERWLADNDLMQFVDAVTDRKIPADVYVDDRAVCFRGDFDETLKQVLQFQPFWQASA